MDKLTKFFFFNAFENGVDKLDERNAICFESRAELVRFITNTTGNFHVRTEKKYFEMFTSLATQQVAFAKIYEKIDDAKRPFVFKTRQPFAIHTSTKVFNTPKVFKSRSKDAESGYVEREIKYQRGYEIVFDDKMVKAYKLAKEQSYIQINQPKNLIKQIEGKSIDLFLKINDFLCAKYTTYLLISKYEKIKDVKFLLDIDEMVEYLQLETGYKKEKTKVLNRILRQLDKMIEIGHFIKSYKVKNNKVEIQKIK